MALTQLSFTMYFNARFHSSTATSFAATQPQEKFIQQLYYTFYYTETGDLKIKLAKKKNKI